MKTRKQVDRSLLDADPLWYKDAIIYELHVRAFRDSNEDGIGDLRGLVEKLDYLQDLGVTTVWLLPFYPSPLRDDGYDIADYTDVNSIYGNLSDFKAFMREAHRRGLRVITELVINHTSDRHPWFQRARRSPPGSAWRNYYVWSDTSSKYQDARVIFSDFESSNWAWDPVAKAYFWHRFYSHQPDLNFDNPAVHEAVFNVLEFWLDLGIDGLRLDAVPYLYEREGTNCENLPETHHFLKALRKHVDERFQDRMLLAEANQWPEDAVTYFGQGDECQMAFHFPLMPRLFMAIRMEDRFPIIDILQQTPAIPEVSQWALFLRNHDELTLEMVTAEDRDYMVRVYAQDMHARINLGIRRRLAPLLENHRGKIELMNGLLFSLPGTPVLYYGDEIGMGDNIYLGDRNGVRTPMQWTPERNAGFSHANPQRLYLPAIIDPEYHYQTVNVEGQQNNPHSLLWWMKRLIALRKRHRAFGRGTLEFLYPENHKVIAFVRRYQNEQILVVANLSRFVQGVELDLSAFKGLTPIEMLGRTALPVVGTQPYLLTLGPYAFYWLALEPKSADQSALATSGERLVTLEVIATWQEVLRSRTKETLEPILLDYLRHQRWFAGKGGDPPAPGLSSRSQSPMMEPAPSSRSFRSIMWRMNREPFWCPSPSGRKNRSRQTKRHRHPRASSRLPSRSAASALVGNPVKTPKPAFSTIRGVRKTSRWPCWTHSRTIGAFGAAAVFCGLTTPAFHHLRGFSDPRPETIRRTDQNNTSVEYGDRLHLKAFRCVEDGIHPEVEIGRALAEKTTFTQTAPVAGVLQYRPSQGQPTTLATLLQFVHHEGDAWHLTLDVLRRFFEHILTRPDRASVPIPPSRQLFDGRSDTLPPLATELIGSYLETARLLGQRTAEMHVALASLTDDPEFAPEPFTLLYQRSSYQTAHTWVVRVMNQLRDSMNDLSQDAPRADAQIVLGRTSDLIAHLRAILDRPITAQRIRCHGDYQLNNLLFTGKDFVVIDFEGEVLRPLSNRRHKRSPVSDVSSLLHSLYSAVYTALGDEHLRPEDRPVLAPWGHFWQQCVAAALTKAYWEVAGAAPFLPKAHAEMGTLLDFYLLGRSVSILRYQLLNRSSQAERSLRILLDLLEKRDREPTACDGDGIPLPPIKA